MANSLLEQISNLVNSKELEKVIALTNEEDLNGLHGPELGEILFYRGFALGQCRGSEDAIREYKKAIDEGFDQYSVYFNIGNALRRQQRQTEALYYYEKALTLAPIKADILSNMALCHESLGEVEKAYEARYDAYSADQGNKIYSSNFALSLMRNGEFEKGLYLYEDRTKRVPDIRLSPTWERNSTIIGKKILVVQEQGIGDIIMFGGLIDEAREQMSSCTLVCNTQIRDIMKRSLNDVEVTSTVEEDEIRSFDEIIGIGSLGYLTRRGESFRPVRPYISSRKDRVDQFIETLKQHEGRKSIGLAWRGGSSEEDKERRSIGLTELIRELRIEDHVLVSLQYGDVENEIREVEDCLGIEIIRLTDPKNDIDEVLAAIECMDEIVTVQQSLVHFASAMGKECRVLVPFMPEWRYGMQPRRMHWWESPRLYRQKELGRWKDPLEELEQELRVALDYSVTGLS